MKAYLAKQNSQAVDFDDLPSVSGDYYRRKYIDNPYLMKHEVPSSCLMEINSENRMKYFYMNCPICGCKIHGRPAEYPHYRKYEDKYLFLCRWCSSLKNIKVE